MSGTTICLERGSNEEGKPPQGKERGGGDGGSVARGDTGKKATQEADLVIFRGVRTDRCIHSATQRGVASPCS